MEKNKAKFSDTDISLRELLNLVKKNLQIKKLLKKN